MDELYEDRSVLAFVGDCPVVVGPRGKIIHGLSAGDSIDIRIAGDWQRATVCAGSGRGWYYETESGLRGRFATSMQVRFVCVAQQDEEVSTSESVKTFAEQVAFALSVGFVLVRRCPDRSIVAFPVSSALSIGRLVS